MRIIGLLPMSKFDFKKLREQCQATGKMLQETFKATDKQLQSYADRTNDPEWQRKHKEQLSKLKDNPKWRKSLKDANAKRAADPEWQRKQKERNKKFPSDPEWKKNHADAIAKRNSNPEWQKKHKERMIALASDPEWKKNMLTATKKSRMKPCITPFGIFATGAEAGLVYSEKYNVAAGNSAVCRHLKKGTEGYRYITVEEYILLTGKEL